jgi:hypothetical protein
MSEWPGRSARRTPRLIELVEITRARGVVSTGSTTRALWLDPAVQPGSTGRGGDPNAQPVRRQGIRAEARAASGEVGVAVWAGPAVSAGAGAVVGPAGEGFGSVVPAAEAGEVVGVGLPGWSVLLVGVDVVLVAGAGVDGAAGEDAVCVAQDDQFPGGRGGSWASTAGQVVGSRTGRMVTPSTRRSQSPRRPRVADPSFSTRPPAAAPLSSVARSAAVMCR